MKKLIKYIIISFILVIIFIQTNRLLNLYHFGVVKDIDNIIVDNIYLEKDRLEMDIHFIDSTLAIKDIYYNIEINELYIELYIELYGVIPNDHFFSSSVAYGITDEKLEWVKRIYITDKSESKLIWSK